MTTAQPQSLLVESLTYAARTLRAQFDETGLFAHRPSKGAERERLLAELLQPRVPGHIEVFHNAEVISVDGERSAQCDLVLADRSTPPLFGTSSNRLIPAECVYTVIEVKSKIDGKELKSACDNIKQAKSIPKTAFVRAAENRIHHANGKAYPYIPTLGMIFAFDGISLDAQGDWFGEWVAERPVKEVPDSIWTLGKGFITWRNKNGHAIAVPENADAFQAWSPHGDIDILVPFLLELNTFLSSAWMNPLDLARYAGPQPIAVAERLWNRNATPEPSSNDNSE
ncbi:DUF6602 domain-containing protein [Streptomyces sp. FXJ1.4098]|nr:DUF6602 domain-containing protein [Streptomyces sp. FXJ1.4098]